MLDFCYAFGSSVIGNVALQNLQGFDARGERYLVVVSHQTFHHIGYPRKKSRGL